MKTIGIITIVKVNNYGAELQAFALQHKLCLMGYDAEIIDYLFYKNKGFKREKISKPFYHFPLKKKIKEWLLPYYENLRSLPYKKNQKKRDKLFENFHKSFTKFSIKTYHSYSELYDYCPKYDIYCVGSDQVWNPSCFTSLYPYFLTFAPEGARKISYASSFGVRTLPTDAIQGYKRGLSGLDAISVREQSGVNLVEKICGKKANLVLDPTLLLSRDEWRTVANHSKVPDKPYILLYVLKDSEFATQRALEIAKKQNLIVVRLCKLAYKQDKEDSGIIDIIDAGPGDFVGLFDNASYVVTNSFHGTAFSINFNKQFTVVLKPNKDNNSRMLDLLTLVGLKDQIVYEGNNKFAHTVDYEIVNKKLSTEKQFSLDYLKRAIENE